MVLYLEKIKQNRLITMETTTQLEEAYKLILNVFITLSNDILQRHFSKYVLIVRHGVVKTPRYRTKEIQYIRKKEYLI